MARVEITDEESAEAWLKEQPHQIRIWFAVRCALRAVPGLQAEPDETFDRLVFVSFRALLISTAAATCPAAEIREFGVDSAAAAAAAAAAAHTSAFTATHSAAFTACSADSAVYSAADSATYSASAAFSVSYSGLAEHATYSATSADTEHPGTWPFLWPKKQMPDGFDMLWPELKSRLNTDPEKWAFWLEWYEAILEGKPLDWDLTRRIAREVTGAEWASGPEVVARRIEEIRARSELERRIGALEQSRDDTQSTASRLGIGGNNPPEPLGEVQGIAREVTIVWASVDELKTQVRSRTPDKDRVSEIVETLSLGLRAILRWCSHKADLAVDTLIKWGIPVGGAALVANPELLKAVIEAARNWLSFL